jgi:predicted deacylase
MKKEKISIYTFDESFEIHRIIGSVLGKEKSPTVVFFGGIHGNEVAGVIALKKVMNQIKSESIPLNGNFYAIAGNLKAMEIGERFLDVDLNRIWTNSELENSALNLTKEYEEREEVYQVIKGIIASNKGPFYFIDLHTTSAETKPFITISDSLNNRKFSKAFSIPTVLGIEEYLDGPLLTYINEFGHVALGFEAGEHYKESSVDNSIAFIWLALEASGCIDKKEIKKYSFYKHYLSLFRDKQEFYEINYKYAIEDGEQFIMNSGFSNFENIKVKQPLAISNNKTITAPNNGKIFMPLYQKQGDDGFFIISKISKFWLGLSVFVRRLKLYKLLSVLPGVRIDKENKYTLIVNPNKAKFLATEIFHLFGFRKKVVKNNMLYFIRRDRVTTNFA